MKNTIKKRIGLKIVALLCLLLPSCKTTYLPVAGETIVKDSLIIETRIDTIEVKLPPERVKDYSDLKDTLRLSTAFAISESWVDMEKGILAGQIRNIDIPLEVPVTSTNTLERKDSIIYKEIPYRVEITKEKKVYPLWMIILSCLGIASTLIISFQVYLKIKKRI